MQLIESIFTPHILEIVMDFIVYNFHQCELTLWYLVLDLAQAYFCVRNQYQVIMVLCKSKIFTIFFQYKAIYLAKLREREQLTLAIVLIYGITLEVIRNQSFLRA